MLGERGAVLSSCGRYRYLLTRRWDESLPAVLFVMLNPSTADHKVDDPTVRRCLGFARRDGYGALYICNLLPLRATDPRELLTHAHPEGILRLNSEHLATAARSSAQCVVAWGQWGARHPTAVAETVAQLAVAGAVTHCIGTTKAGQPRHPLYLRRDAPVVPWPAPG